MGFKTAVLTNVQVLAATPASVRVTLEVGGLEETVIVSGGSEIIQTQSAAVTSTIDTNQILKLPTGSRSALHGGLHRHQLGQLHVPRVPGCAQSEPVRHGHQR